MYSALDIARYIIWRENSEERPVSNLRLQKLLYFVYVCFLCTFQRRCFAEPIEAWTFGPVVPIVYGEYKIFGSSAISSPQNFSDSFLTVQHRENINHMLDSCAALSTGDLVERTHSQTPWIAAYNNPFNHRITDEAIRNYFGDSTNG